ncbi:MAG: hypothetical protein R3C53_11595 [Pirellulaceae bacterium]
MNRSRGAGRFWNGKSTPATRLSRTLCRQNMKSYPEFPICSCEFHSPDGGEQLIPVEAVNDPFLYLPDAVPFTEQMEVLARRYRAFDIDWMHYPAFQAASFLQPKSNLEHQRRRDHFTELKTTAESQGFKIPESITRLYMSDEIIDRLHHNCVWPSLPEEIVRLPGHSELALFLFLIEGQGSGIWHLLLYPDGSNIVVNADARFGCPSGYPPGKVRDPATINVQRCFDSLNRLLYQYFVESELHDQAYIERLSRYFDETKTA